MQIDKHFHSCTTAHWAFRRHRTSVWTGGRPPAQAFPSAQCPRPSTTDNPLPRKHGDWTKKFGGRTVPRSFRPAVALPLTVNAYDDDHNGSSDPILWLFPSAFWLHRRVDRTAAGLDVCVCGCVHGPRRITELLPPRVAPLRRRRRRHRHLPTSVISQPRAGGPPLNFFFFSANFPSDRCNMSRALLPLKIFFPWFGCAYDKITMQSSTNKHLRDYTCISALCAVYFRHDLDKDRARMTI